MDSSNEDRAEADGRVSEPSAVLGAGQTRSVGATGFVRILDAIGTGRRRVPHSVILLPMTCSKGHPTSPSAKFCGTCGMPVAVQTKNRGPLIAGAVIVGIVLIGALSQSGDPSSPRRSYSPPTTAATIRSTPTTIPLFRSTPTTIPLFRSNSLAGSDSGGSSIEIYGSKGTVSYTEIGNTVFGSDGSSYTKIGGTVFGNDGTSYTNIGGTTFGSDGSSCTEIGSTTFCHGG